MIEIEIKLKLIFDELKLLTGRVKSLIERTTDAENAIKEIRKRFINTEKSDLDEAKTTLINALYHLDQCIQKKEI
jgi:hypothetical protein